MKTIGIIILTVILMTNSYSQTNEVNYNFQSDSLKRKIRKIQLGEINMEYLLTGVENKRDNSFRSWTWSKFKPV